MTFWNPKDLRLSYLKKVGKQHAVFDLRKKSVRHRKLLNKNYSNFFQVFHFEMVVF